jgi:hypothetical protein
MIQCKETLTNAAGSASATSYPLFVPIPVSIAQVSVKQNAVSISATCLASTTCRLIFTLRWGGAVSAAKKPQGFVILGTKTVTIAAGRSQIVHVTLNRTGRRLLSRGHKLRVKLEVTDARIKVTGRTGRAVALLATRTITLTPTTRQKR